MFLQPAKYFANCFPHYTGTFCSSLQVCRGCKDIEFPGVTLLPNRGVQKFSLTAFYVELQRFGGRGSRKYMCHIRELLHY